MFPSPSAMWDCARAFADVGELLFYFLHRETTDCLFASQCRLKTFFLPFRLNPQSIPSLRKRLGRVPPPAKHSALCSSASCVSASNRTCAPNPKSFAKAVESPNSAIKFDSRVHRQPNAT